MRMAAFAALAVAVLLGVAGCRCMGPCERGERWDGHHNKMMSCPACESAPCCPMCGRPMVCPECRERMDRMGRGMGMGRPAPMPCPMCNPMVDKQQCGEMMEHMRMAPHMRMHCMAMMNAKLLPAEPAKLMAMEEHLKLTQEQMDKLTKIQKDAAAQAEAVLTADQKAMVETMKELPATMMGMHMHMHKMMKGGMMEKTGGQHEMNEEMKDEAK